MNIDETTKQLMRLFTDCGICEDHAGFPYTLPPEAATVTVASEDLPALMQAMLSSSAAGHTLVAVSSPRSFKIACALNETLETNHMAICYQDTWEAEAFLKEIRYEDSLLTDEHGTEYCVGKSIFRDKVYMDINGRILLKGTEKLLYSSIPLKKKRSGDIWGSLLLHTAFRKEHFLGLLTEMPVDFCQRILILYHVFCQLKMQPDALLPVTDSILVFRDGEVLIPEWKQSFDKTPCLNSFCFEILFGTAQDTCRDIMGTMLSAVCSAKEVPAFFLSELERAFFNQVPYTTEQWEAVLLHARTEMSRKEKSE